MRWTFIPLRRMNRNGFSLIELMLVIGIVASLSGVVIPVYREYQVRNDLALATEQVTQGLARARLLSEAGQNDDGWGFYIPSGTLFKGAQYALRDVVYDETYPMPSTITTTGLTEVSYAQLSGVPTSTGAITLTAINRDQRTVLISVQKQSVAVVNPDEFVICHIPPGNPGGMHTIAISDAAWPAHENHGDTLGPCPGGGGQASSSSIAMSSSSASSAAPPPPESCEARFSVAENGTITAAGPLDVTFRALGSEITFGEGGPEIAVTVKRQNPVKTKKWIKVFGGNDIDGGEVETATYDSGQKVVLQIRGHYKKNAWLSFDETYDSDDSEGHIVVLRDGDALPSYPVFDDQGNLADFLQDILDAEGNVDIGQFDAVLLVELGTLNSSAADFQDAVLLLEFGEPAC